MVAGHNKKSNQIVYLLDLQSSFKEVWIKLGKC